MSLATDYNFQTKKRLGVDTTFGPFEVVDMGNKMVGINLGAITISSSAFSIKPESFISSAKPQDLLGAQIDPGKLLSVSKNNYVCIVISEADTSAPKVEIKAISAEDIGAEQNKRKVNRLVKLALIKNIEDVAGSSYIEIKNIYVGNIVTEAENWPPFTPILWPVEAADGTYSSWRAVFIPGSIYLPQTMTDATVFQLNGNDMTEYPMVEIQPGDTYYASYKISADWEIEGAPKFSKETSDEEVCEVRLNCDEDGNDGDICGSCGRASGKFHVKIVTFEGDSQSIKPKMHWRSDICIYGWSLCSEDCTSSGGSGGGLSSSEGSGGGSGGSDKSTAIVPARFSPTGFVALYTAEMPEVRFDDIITLDIEKRKTEVFLDHKFVSVCEKNSIRVCGFSIDKPEPIGFSIVSDILTIKRKKSFFNKKANITLRLTGIRKGFKDKRFPTRTKAQFDANEIFLNSAYPKE